MRCLLLNRSRVLNRFSTVILLFVVTVHCKMSKWNIVKRLVLQKGTFSVLSFQGSDPELCLSLFNNTMNFNGLKKRLQTANQKWIEEFLERGGLDSMLNYLSQLNSKRTYTFVDALKQLECIGCVKHIMDHPIGMEYVVMTGGKSVNTITEGIVNQFICTNPSVHIPIAICGADSYSN